MSLIESKIPKEIVVSDDDCIAVLDLLNVFDIEDSDDVAKSIKDFMNDKTLYNQRKITVELCKLLHTSKNSIFEYGMWDNLKEYANSTAYNVEFDLDLEEVIKVAS